MSCNWSIVTLCSTTPHSLRLMWDRPLVNLLGCPARSRVGPAIAPSLPAPSAQSHCARTARTFARAERELVNPVWLQGMADVGGQRRSLDGALGGAELVAQSKDLKLKGYSGAELRQ